MKFSQNKIGAAFHKALLEHGSNAVKVIVMAIRAPRTERRTTALSKEAIVEAAIEILDSRGEAALTFRSLAARLSTGSGAIYWHVADKQALLAAATDHIIAGIMIEPGSHAPPSEEIRNVALGVFDAIDAHPWVGGQLSRDPWQYGVLRILEMVGGRVQALGVPEDAHFNIATAIMSFILGLAAQYALGAGVFDVGMDRTAALRAIARKWAQLDPERHPFVRHVATQLRHHDDREQFVAGINLILAGVEMLRDDGNSQSTPVLPRTQ